MTARNRGIDTEHAMRVYERVRPNPRPAFCIAGLILALGTTSAACREVEAKVKGPGDSLKAFIIENCATYERYCQVCAYSGSPTIMAVGDVDDAEFAKDLKKIQALYENHKADGLTAFALYGKFTDGALASVSENADTLKRLAALRKELGLTFPVTVLPRTLTTKESMLYRPFGESYDVRQSRTVMVAQANNKVVWADVMKGQAAQYAALAGAVKKAL